MKKNHKGVIYILTNPSFPLYVKLGYATDVEKRLRQLNRSETIPYAFRVYAIYETDGALTDKELHALIDRLNPDLRAIETFDGKKRTKEFYAMSKENAYSILESIAKISGTQDCLKKMAPEGHEILDEQTAEDVTNESRRGPFTFSMCDIPVGSEICFTKDNNIKAVVVDDKHVTYDEETLSVSALAYKLLGKTSAVAGTLYFTYQGKTL